MPAAAMAAAAWSWVEKMLQDDQVISAPRALRVSMRTAVWMARGKLLSALGFVEDWSGVRVEHTHVQATSDAGTLQGLVLGVLLTGGHETGHLLLGEINLATAKGREVDVGNLVDKVSEMLATASDLGSFVGHTLNWPAGADILADVMAMKEVG
jgi:hypothetical protein